MSAPRVALGRAELAAAARVIPAPAIESARAAIAAWPGYAPTPVAALPGFARGHRLGGTFAKLEGHRFEVGSFKALGPAYALERAHARRPIEVAVAATSGNHGRAVAWGARRLGIACRIFVAGHVSEPRAAAIRALGADVTRVAGDFDAAFAAATQAARAPAHALIADTGGPDGDAIARDILAGYGVLGLEIAALTERPSHVFVGAGHGALAAGVCAGLAAGGASGVRVVAVEPAGADALRASLAAGRATTLTSAAPSLMDGLVSADVSAAAWPALGGALAAALAIDDEAARSTLRAAAAGAWGDAKLAVGESGIAALAGLAAAAADPATRDALGLDARARALAIACEGVTDPELFAALTAA